jgi:hypothetical protein
VALNRALTAYHEAGHAVVAHRLGYRVEGASIVEKEGSKGRIKLPNPMHRKDPKLARHRIWVEHAAIIALAGPLTQKRHNPHSHWRSAGVGYGKFMTKGTDFQIVSQLIDRVHGEGKVAQIFWRYLEAQAEELIDINWPKIEHVAQALLEHGTLSGDEVRIAMLKAAGINWDEIK